MLTKFVKPVRGVVLMPERGFQEMPASGKAVPVNAYYQSLLRFGDVVEVPKPKPLAAKGAPTRAVAATAKTDS